MSTPAELHARIEETMARANALMDQAIARLADAHRTIAYLEQDRAELQREIARLKLALAASARVSRVVGAA